MSTNRFSLCLLLSLFTYFINAQVPKGYEIKLRINAFQDSTIILAHYFGRENSYYPDDTLKLDKKGAGIFHGTNRLKNGMYIIYLPNQHFFDFLIGEDQFFTIQADTSDLFDKTSYTGSQDNLYFMKYKTFRNEIGIKANQLEDMKKKSTSSAEQDSISGKIALLSKEMVKFSDSLIHVSSPLFFSRWLKSFQEIQIPSPPRNENGENLDSSFQYRYYRKHYFDNFDLSDPAMLRSPFYESKLNFYLDKMVPAHPDSMIAALDELMNRCGKEVEIRHFMLGTLYNRYATMANEIVGMDAVFIYFAEHYYLPEATWMDEKFKQNLIDRIRKIKPLLIGRKAPSINLIGVPAAHFKAAAADTALKSNPYVGAAFNLDQVKAKYLVLIFWEADCGHCKKALPLLYDSVYSKIREYGAEVLAIQALHDQEGKRKWIDFVNQHRMYDWINAWSPYSLEYRSLFDVLAFPCIYILDEKKQIICKRIGVEQVEAVLKMDIAREKLAVKP